MIIPQNNFTQNRRSFLGGTTGALGMMALTQLLGVDSKSSAADSSLTVKNQLPSKAKSVICLFQHGGPSQMDLFDPKPELTKQNGKPYQGDIEAHFDKQKGNCLASPFQFAPRGESGIEMCEHLPHTASIADELTLVRSMTTESVDHEAALRLIHTGKFSPGWPTWGSWVIYGLGAENQNLPAYVVLSDPGGLPIDGTKNWTSGWLPAIYQGSMFRTGASPVANLTHPSLVTPAAQKRQLEFLKQLNTLHNELYPQNSELQARVKNYEIAARMQTAVPAVLDITAETKATQKMYGIDNPTTAEYGRRCLMARRLVESGVRFVQLFLNGQPWDTHSNNAKNLKGLCARTDQPSAALVKDLKQRGLLDSTIVLWTGEFGRLPISQGKDGRDHNRHAFSLWLAGGGFKSGYTHGATDDFGYKAVEKTVTVHDLHATLLQNLGIDHRKLSFPYDGRASTLSDAEVTGAKVVTELLA
ncbi:DUF1501 domain-containing protein [uncultured Gimesia sp.]|uniref:DUF1501 domain-containing protein n=1 Tax=uncultured Gimesia sp. TaxID=1678688 RepID=UPI002637734E|nr:DUF1501 domain-containing protein [uncultured Gimesia sp.]